MSKNIAKYNVLIEILSDAKGAHDGVKKLRDETTGLRGIFNLAKGSFAGIIAAEAVQRGIRFVSDLSDKTIGMAGAAEQTAISFNTLIGNAERADQLFRDLDKFSIDTPFESTEINNAAKTLLGFGKSADIVLSDLNLIGNASAATGANLQSLAVVFGQVAGTGKLAGQDALQFINQGIPVYQLLSESLGKSVKEFKKLQEDGKITFDVLREAFAKASEDGGKFAGALIKQSESFEGLKSTAAGAKDAVLRTLGEGLLPILKELLLPLINLLFKAVYAFKDFAPLLTGFLRGVLSFGQRIF